MKKTSLFGLGTLALGCCIMLSGVSFAGTFTLVDGNSIAAFDTSLPDNHYSWEVDGVDHLFQQAFWFRLGTVDPETSLHTLPIDVEGTTDTNFDGDDDTLFVRYIGLDFDAEVRYTLDGGAPGSFASDLAEQVSITNTGSIPLDFHFFQYVDFDLAGSEEFDTAVFTNANAVQQTQGPLAISETVITPAASHREIDYFPATHSKLTDASPTTLSDTPAIGTPLGPGDVTWAFQWDVVIAPGLTFQISKDKNLVGVPEPTALALAGLALGGMLFGRRR